ncbi:MAG TPA: hypothetical protein PLX71_08470 [Phycicoccus sp.]|nr:hypothetical protein [Phycicoccus sp.]
MARRAAVSPEQGTTQAVPARSNQPTLRQAARQARLQRGKPFEEFCAEFVTPEPPAELLYYGSWGDVEEITATEFTIDGPKRVTAPLKQLPIIMVPDRREVKIAALEARIAELETKYGEDVQRLT